MADSDSPKMGESPVPIASSSDNTTSTSTNRSTMADNEEKSVSNTDPDPISNPFDEPHSEAANTTSSNDGDKDSGGVHLHQLAESRSAGGDASLPASSNESSSSASSSASSFSATSSSSLPAPATTMLQQANTSSEEVAGETPTEKVQNEGEWISEDSGGGVEGEEGNTRDSGNYYATARDNELMEFEEGREGEGMEYGEEEEDNLTMGPSPQPPHAAHSGGGGGGSNGEDMEIPHDGEEQGDPIDGMGQNKRKGDDTGASAENEEEREGAWKEEGESSKKGEEGEDSTTQLTISPSHLIGTTTAATEQDEQGKSTSQQQELSRSTTQNPSTPSDFSTTRRAMKSTRSQRQLSAAANSSQQQQHQEQQPSLPKRLKLKGTPMLGPGGMATNKPFRLKRPDEEIQLEDQIAVRYTFPNAAPLGGGSTDTTTPIPTTPSTGGLWTPTTPSPSPSQQPSSSTKGDGGGGEQYVEDVHLAVVKHVRRSEEDPSGKEELFYVHFTGEDRRLDVWVGRDAIVDTEKEGISVAPAIFGSGSGTGIATRKFTRRERRFNEEWQNAPKTFEEHDATTAQLEKEHEERTKVKNVEEIFFGGYAITTWYFSPFPAEVIDGAKKVYFCEYCLLYTQDLSLFLCHSEHHCKVRRPPGREIYREGRVAVYEVVGSQHKTYCQSLCLLSKLFLDHKTLYYDVDLFLFYILCELDSEDWAHPVGHFSKELHSDNNLACIMVLPPFMRNGYGKLLIQMSYHLSDLEGRIGTPEKPLSDLGKACYRDYWLYVLLETLDWSWNMGLRKPEEHITISELSEMTGIQQADVYYSFNTLQLVKYWKGSALTRMENGEYMVRVSRQFVQDCRRNKVCHPPKLMLHKEHVHWEPLVLP